MQVIDFIKGEGYEIISFPDGEKHLRIKELDRKDTVAIRCRIKSSDDLFLMMQLSDILNRQCVTIENIEIFYLMSMRCDRLFSFEQPFSLRIVAEVINSFNAERVTIHEPHSVETLKLINKSNSIMVGKNPKEGVLCFPDKGAYRRYKYTLLGFGDAMICAKKRDTATGKLLRFEIEDKGSYNEGDVINVIDDLCDGGGTFCGIADLLRPLNPSELNLYVTHAVQRAGIEKVSKYYDNVFITNSYNDWDNLPINVKLIDITK